MKYYSTETFAIHAARITIQDITDVLVEAIQGVHDPEPKYEQGAAKRGGNYFGRIVLNHEPGDIDIKPLKGYDVVFDPQGTAEDRELLVKQRNGEVNLISTAAKPVQLVREIFEANPGAERKVVIAACLAAGVTKNTAATQYARLKRNLIQGG